MYVSIEVGGKGFSIITFTHQYDVDKGGVILCYNSKYEGKRGDIYENYIYAGGRYEKVF